MAIFLIPNSSFLIISYMPLNALYGSTNAFSLNRQSIRPKEQNSSNEFIFFRSSLTCPEVAWSLDFECPSIG